MPLSFRLFFCWVLMGSAWADPIPPPLDPVEKLTPIPDEALAAATIVVFNENDIDSAALAGYYAEKRAIPHGNLIAVKCSTKEEISRFEYDHSIAGPLRQTLVERGLWKLRTTPNETGRVEETKIRFAVLMRGMPLKIMHEAAYDGDKQEGPVEISAHNEAAVDSELSILGLWSRRISGVLRNPYWRSKDRFPNANQPSMLLVCRLDARTPALVRTMIDHAITAEQEGLRGFDYIDARGINEGPYSEGDRWINAAAADARKHGLPVIQDNGPAIFPTGYPMRQAALYYGWYAENISGALADRNFRFVPGAVAVHLHSFSAITLRDAGHGWCNPMIEAGAAATLGNVYEPYLSLTSNLDVFSQRLREGFTFAEAGYSSLRFLSWMSTFVGDPLYRPFKFTTEGGGLDSKNEWDAYRIGVRVWLTKGRPAGEDSLRSAAKRLDSGVIYEGLGLLLLSAKDAKTAVEVFTLARGKYGAVEDKVRVTVHEAAAIAASKSRTEAGNFVRRQIAAYGDSAGGGVLRLLESALDPATPVPPKPVTTPVNPLKKGLR